MPAPRRNSSGLSQSSTGSITWQGAPKSSHSPSTSPSAMPPNRSSSSSTSSSSSPSPPAALLFSPLEFYLLPGCQSIPLSRTLLDLGAKVQPSPPLLSSSLTPTSSQARRSLTSAFSQLLLPSSPWFVVVEAKEARTLRAILQSWVKEGQGEWGNAAWVDRVRSLKVYDASWVFDSKRKACLQPMESYRVRLLGEEAGVGQGVGTGGEVGKKRRRAVVEEQKELLSLDDSDEDNVFVPHRASSSTASAKRLRVEPPPQPRATASSRAAGRTAGAVSHRRAVASIGSEEEEEDGMEDGKGVRDDRKDRGEHEERPRPSRMRQPSAVAVEALGNRLQAHSQQRGEWQTSPHPQRRDVQQSNAAREEAIGNEEDGDAGEAEFDVQAGDDGEDEEEEIKDGQDRVDEADDRDEEKAVERSAIASQRRKPSSLDQQHSSPPAQQPLSRGSPSKTSHPTGDGGHKSSRLRPTASHISRPPAVPNVSPSKATSSASPATPSPARGPEAVDLTVSSSQQRSQGGGSDVIFETPPSQAVSGSPPVLAQAPTSSSSSSSPVTAPSTPPPSLPITVDFPLPLLLHALYLHSGAVLPAVRYLKRLPMECPAKHPQPVNGCEGCGGVRPWSAEEDQAVKLRNADSDAAAAVVKRRGQRAVDSRRGFLESVASQ